MEIIRISTWINAPMERCFRLATSVELHLASVAQTREKATSGAPPRLLGEGEFLQWQGRHFGQRFTQTNKIDGWRPYNYFREVMVDGSFLRFEHVHHFAVMDDGTRMRDEIHFVAPYGVLGRMAEKTVLRRHLIELLKQRNMLIKRVAETEEWRKYLERTGSLMAARASDELVSGWDKGALQRG